MSILTLFLQADIVVKIVMVLLILASVWVWAIVFEKVTSLRRANRQADAFEDRFWSGGSLDELYDQEGAKPVHPIAAVFGAAMGEWRRSTRIAGADMARGGVRDRVDRAMTVTVDARDGPDGALDGLPGLGRLHRAVHRPVRHGLGHHAQLLGHRRQPQHQPGRGGARHRRGAVRHRDRPGRRHPGRAGLQQDQHRPARFASRLEGFGTEFGAILSRQSEERA